MLSRLPQVLERIETIERVLGELSGSSEVPCEEQMIFGDALTAELGDTSMPEATSSSPRHANGQRTFDGIIEQAARREGLSPDLIHAVVRAESNYRPDARSSAGAMGLMQLMPGTAQGLGVSDPWDPVQNVLGGARYLRQQIDRFGDIKLALAAYNAGPGAVTRHDGIPPFRETQTYVRRVMDFMQQRSASRGERSVGVNEVALEEEEAEGVVLQHDAALAPDLTGVAVDSTSQIIAAPTSGDGDAKTSSEDGPQGNETPTPDVNNADGSRHTAGNRDNLSPSAVESPAGTSVAEAQFEGDSFESVRSPEFFASSEEGEGVREATSRTNRADTRDGSAARSAVESTRENSFPADIRASKGQGWPLSRSAGGAQSGEAVVARSESASVAGDREPFSQIDGVARTDAASETVAVSAKRGGETRVGSSGTVGGVGNERADATMAAVDNALRPLKQEAEQIRMTQIDYEAIEGEERPSFDSAAPSVKETFGTLTDEAATDVHSRAERRVWLEGDSPGIRTEAAFGDGGRVLEGAVQMSTFQSPINSGNDHPTVMIRDAGDLNGLHGSAEMSRFSGAEGVSDYTQRLVVEVDPPELGPCALELRMREGELSAVVLAERPETVAALRSAEPQVRAQLAEQGLEVTQFDVRAGGGENPGAGSRSDPHEPLPSRPLSPYPEGQPDGSEIVRSRTRPGRQTTIDLVA